jgi:hypothetical protein
MTSRKGALKLASICGGEMLKFRSRDELIGQKIWWAELKEIYKPGKICICGMLWSFMRKILSFK